MRLIRLQRGLSCLALVGGLALTGCRATALEGAAGTEPLAAVGESAPRLRPPGPREVIQHGGLTTDRLEAPAFAPDATGDSLLAVWRERREKGEARVFARRLSSDFTPLYPPLALRTEFALAEKSSDQAAPAVAFDGREFVCAWEDHRADAPGVYMRRVSADGRLVGAEQRLGGAGAGAPTFADAPIAGRLLLAWQETEGARASLIEPSQAGAPLPLSESRLNLGPFGWLGAEAEAPRLAADPAGNRFLAAWRRDGRWQGRFLSATGAAGAVFDLGAGRALRLVHHPKAGFVALCEREGQIVAQGVAEGGLVGAPTRLGEGTDPVAVYDPASAVLSVFWRSNGYAVRQNVGASGTALSLAGPAQLLPTAGARSLAVMFSAPAQAPVLALEEHLYGFDRLSLLTVR